MRFLKKMREEMGLSQAEMARQLSISPEAYHKNEHATKGECLI
jgi:DNA-binding XRE family transcriptional regulator